jgi:calcineurin-like phosphoesterase family protein
MDSRAKAQAWCLHGHIHSINPFGSLANNMEVGYDTWGGPISYNERIRENLIHREQELRQFEIQKERNKAFDF